jgi:DNA-binding HxlR family transcriptional regulator
MYILWILQSQGAMRFGALKRQVDGISTKVLTERLRMLETEGLIYRDYVSTVPPQVTYGLTERMKDLTEVLEQLNTIALHWYGQDPLAQGINANTNKDV